MADPALATANVFTAYEFEFSIDAAGRRAYLRTFLQLGIPLIVASAVAAYFIARVLRFHVNRVARCVSSFVWPRGVAVA